MSGSPIASGVEWLQGLLFGPVLTIVATIAIAWFGFQMLRGKVPLRRGLTLILGIFILFGAPTIAAGLIQIAGSSSQHPKLPPTFQERTDVSESEPDLASPYARPSVSREKRD